MNTEVALDSIKTVIVEKIAETLTTLENEAIATTQTPELAESKIGDCMPTEFTQFPAIFIRANTTSPKNDQYQWQERTLNFVIVAWVVEVDAELLHRFIVRYGDAIGRILKDPDNWSGYLSSPVIGTTSYSDIYTVEHGLAQGCSIEGTVEFFI